MLEYWSQQLNADAGTFRRAANIVPQCPRCGCLMDKQGESFASKNICDGINYFCNNPVCHIG
jgi:hypothetical protein